MREKQKTTLKVIKTVEIVIVLITGIVAYQTIKHEYFNGDPVNYARWACGLLVWIFGWLILYRMLSFPEE